MRGTLFTVLKAGKNDALCIVVLFFYSRRFILGRRRNLGNPVAGRYGGH